MLSLEALFCKIDDFCQDFEAQWTQRLLKDGCKQRQRQRSMSLSEIITILVAFHQQGYRNFKTYYHNHVSVYWRSEFPTLVSYSRLIEYLPSVLLPLCAYLRHCFGICRGISFIDSTALRVCHVQRAHQHRVFQGLATWGKTSMGWFFGLKLHLVVNDQGELLDCCLTPGNTDDRKPVTNLLKGGLIAYCHQPKKPSLDLAALGIELPA